MNSPNESKRMGTHPPTRLGKVLLELLGDRRVDVPLALLSSDPAVLKGIAENKIKVRKWEVEVKEQ